MSSRLRQRIIWGTGFHPARLDKSGGLLLLMSRKVQWRNWFSIGTKEETDGKYESYSHARRWRDSKSALGEGTVEDGVSRWSGSKVHFSTYVN
jgi:hypothetical protein